jgi:hypothetical protein
LTAAEKLADAKTQYHLLVTGQQAKVYVDQNGERVEFTTANRGALLAYIQKLEREVNSARPGPMQVIM